MRLTRLAKLASYSLLLLDRRRKKIIASIWELACMRTGLACLQRRRITLTNLASRWKLCWRRRGWEDHQRNRNTFSFPHIHFIRGSQFFKRPWMLLSTFLQKRVLPCKKLHYFKCILILFGLRTDAIVGMHVCVSRYEHDSYTSYVTVKGTICVYNAVWLVCKADFVSCGVLFLQVRHYSTCILTRAKQRRRFPFEVFLYVFSGILSFFVFRRINSEKALDAIFASQTAYGCFVLLWSIRFVAILCGFLFPISFFVDQLK